jgi:MoaA/NifB/PqqE/SkfB family radical SAM enzyme
LAKKKCPESSVVIATNAHLLTPTLTRELVARPVDIIYLHISAGTPTTYEKIMYPLKWSRTIANAQRLIKQFKGKVVINFVKTLDNMGEVAWLRKIFPSVSIITRYWACNRGGRLDLPKMGKSRFHSCDELVNLPILQDGTILLCCNCWGRDVVLGNAYRDNILKVWQTNYMKPKYDICKDCW